MHQLAFRLFAATALTLSLSACVVDPALTGVPAAPAAPTVKTDDLPADAKLIEGVYSTKSDPQFTVPAVPVEKVPQEFQRQTVDYPSDQPVGTIIINPSARHLYLVTGKNRAVRYGIAVGKAGFQWSGEALITDRKNWPTWTPPKEMIARKPELSKWEKGQPGGLENPLGARALYLTTNGVDYGYRIHGTPDWASIGKNASSGCIRMINQDVMDLYERVPNNTKVVVLNADGSMPSGLTLPPPPPKKAAAVASKPKSTAAKPVAQPAIIVPKPSVMPTPVVTSGAPAVTPTATSVVTPTVTAVTPAPAIVTPAPTVKPATPAVTCSVPLVNGVCPSN